MEFPCSSEVDTECKSCTTCSPHEFEVTPCGLSSDTSCQNCTTCSSGYYEKVSCAGRQNTICAECTPLCPKDEFMVSQCTSEDDTHCQKCTVCSDGEYVAENCTSISDTACRQCTPCPHGSRKVAPCTEFQDYVCEFDSNVQSTIVELLLGQLDVNSIQSKINLGTSQLNTYLTQSAGALLDLVGNVHLPIDALSAKQGVFAFVVIACSVQKMDCEKHIP